MSLPQQPDVQKIDELNASARNLREPDAKRSLELAQTAYELAQAAQYAQGLDNCQGQADLFLALARSHLNLANFSDSVELSQRAHKLAHENGRHLVEADAQQAYDLMERIRSRLVAHKMDVPGLSISFSAGITMLSDANDTLDALLARADQSLYRSKKAGGNHISITT